MTPEELEALYSLVWSNAKKLWHPTGHFWDRARERHFTLADVVNAIGLGGIIEAHDDARPDIRVLFRDAHGTCVVISLTNWRVITVYYNAPDDSHISLNWTLYRWSKNMADVVNKLRVSTDVPLQAEHVVVRSAAVVNPNQGRQHGAH